MAAMTIARGLREKRSAAKSDQALRRVLSFLDHNNNHKIRLEDFIDMMEEHSVEMEAEEVLELCELTEVTGEICHSTLIIFIKNAKVWRFLEKQVVRNGPQASLSSTPSRCRRRAPGPGLRPSAPRSTRSTPPSTSSTPTATGL